MPTQPLFGSRAPQGFSRRLLLDNWLDWAGAGVGPASAFHSWDGDDCVWGVQWHPTLMCPRHSDPSRGHKQSLGLSVGREGCLFPKPLQATRGRAEGPSTLPLTGLPPELRLPDGQDNHKPFGFPSFFFLFFKILRYV